MVTGRLEHTEEIKFKLIDSFHRSDAISVAENEVLIYKTLEKIQGDVIPKFYGYFNLHGIIILALEDCGVPLKRHQYRRFESVITASINKLDRYGVQHDDLLEARGGVYPNILIKDDKIKLIDFHRATFQPHSQLVDKLRDLVVE